MNSYSQWSEWFMNIRTNKYKEIRFPKYNSNIFPNLYCILSGNTYILYLTSYNRLFKSRNVFCKQIKSLHYIMFVYIRFSTG